MNQDEQEELVRLLRFLLQKIQRYLVSHSGLSIKTAKEKMHDTLQLANAISESEEFLEPFNTERGWRGFMHRLTNRDG